METPAQIFLQRKADRPGQDSGLLVFFIPGNPGSIEYYRTTLEHIFSSLKEGHDTQSDLTVFGSSLVGFDSHVHNETPYIQVDQRPRPPLDLESQTKFMLDTLLAVLDCQKVPQRIVLAGHSIGAYMVLKLIEKTRVAPSILGSSNIVAGICLFPTVVDIAKSPTGRIMAPLLRIPLFPTLIHYISRPLQLLPLPELIGLVRSITGMPVLAATTTAKFLQSPAGVHQALFLAADEMRSVTDDRWDDRLWGITEREEAAATGATVASGAVEGEGNVSRLFFYWGGEDHWVANTTRDALIAKRGRGAVASKGEEGKPVMEIDGHGIPHAFPLKPEHSRIVAAKVAEWVIEIQKDMR